MTRKFPLAKFKVGARSLGEEIQKTSGKQLVVTLFSTGTGWVVHGL